jgi:hypothetical protein
MARPFCFEQTKITQVYFERVIHLKIILMCFAWKHEFSKQNVLAWFIKERTNKKSYFCCSFHNTHLINLMIPNKSIIITYKAPTASSSPLKMHVSPRVDRAVIMATKQIKIKISCEESTFAMLLSLAWNDSNLEIDQYRFYHACLIMVLATVIYPDSL